MAVLKTVLGVCMLGGALVFAPRASALPPGPFCPGDGTDITVLGMGGGYCNFMFMPDGTYVHCEFGGASVVLFEIASVSNCWRVAADGTRIPPPPLVRNDPWASPPEVTDQP